MTSSTGQMIFSSTRINNTLTEFVHSSETEFGPYFRALRGIFYPDHLTDQKQRFLLQ